MTMLNQAAVEALCSATYLENYLETMENLPDDLQRCVTQLRELDLLCMEMLQDIHNYKDMYRTEPEGPSKRKAFVAIQRALIRSQEIGDEKLHLVSVIIEHIENRSRQLEQDLENLDPSTGKDHEKDEIIIISKPIKQDIEKVEKTAAKRQRRHRIHQDSISKDEDKKDDKVPKKKKKRKTKKDKDGDRSPIDPPIDPNEPTYCLCDQVSYGEMIGCDNDGCPIEWFHFNCVNLTIKPKGKWFCPKCRGDKSNVKRSDVKL